LVGLLITALGYVYTQAKEKTDQRLDLLRRTRAAHVRIAHAKRILKANDSAELYVKEMRKLMLVIPVLEDIAADVAAAKHLFGKDNDDIKGGIDGMVKFLEEGYTEYEEWPPPRITRPVGGWLTELVSDKEMPCCYNTAVDNSKGRMRFHVYGSTAPKDHPPGGR
jgi:hypothetical protein